MSEHGIRYRCTNSECPTDGAWLDASRVALHRGATFYHDHKVQGTLLDPAAHRPNVTRMPGTTHEPFAMPCGPVAELTGPQRIRLRRKKGYRKPAGAVVVARPTRWGNPWVVGDNVTVGYMGKMDGPSAGRYNPSDVRGWCMENGQKITAVMAVQFYREDLATCIADPDPFHDELRAALAALAGHDLACWCRLSDPCHADVLLEAANGRAAGGLMPYGVNPITRRPAWGNPPGPRRAGPLCSPAGGDV